ncbi:MAG: hypothetical protein IJK83_09635 [Clostridiales bacterium]|nr:hypothetical protein [Clostridiales bacterium]
MKALDIKERLLAESKNYYLTGSSEEVNLYRKSDDKHLACVGDFYGDPNDALIDQDERFCISVGCGYILYRLNEPFQSYQYDVESCQWTEEGRGPDNIDWYDKVEQISSNELVLTDEAGNKRILKV